MPPVLLDPDVKFAPGMPVTLPARLAAERLIVGPVSRERFARSNRQFAHAQLTDYYFGTDIDRCDPRDVFEVLRWGGQFVFVTHQPREAERLHKRFGVRDDYVTQPIETFVGPRFDSRLLRLRRTYYTFRARKVLLTRLEEATDRHSYDVRLIPSSLDPCGWVVHKRVPSHDDAAARLGARFPDVPTQTIRAAAVKLVDKVYPIFLTREAAFLKILQRELPEAYQHRVPTPLQIDKDERGFVRELRMSWLRLGGDLIDQLTFARQAADLLTILHDRLNIVHLDLRLDNYVVTPHGVGFVDFGSASRIGEDFSKSTILRSFFDDMLSSSQVQRDLRRLQRKGMITSKVFEGCYHKIDKAVDLFYLLMEINRPLDNPDFRGLVEHDRRSGIASMLSAFARTVYRPPDPRRPTILTTGDIRRELDRMVT